MSDEKQKKDKKKLLIVFGIIGGIIFLFFIVIIFLVFIGILTAIAVPAMHNAADKAKQNALKANVSAGTFVVTNHLYGNGETPEVAVKAAIIELQQAETPNDPSDDPKNPFSPELPAYDSKPGPGVVEIVVDSGPNAVKIIGYGKDGSTVLSSQTVTKQIETK